VNPLILVVALSAAVVLFSGSSRGQSLCPIERVVGQIEKIAGDPMAVHILRRGHEVPAIQNACILFGDEVDVGPEATVTIDTTKGQHLVGGHYDPEWVVPEAKEAASPDASAFLTALYNGIFGSARMGSASAVGRAPGRGSGPCPQSPARPPPLLPLDRLNQTRQEIGSDLRFITAAWKPLPDPITVQATLRGAGGQPVIDGDSCWEAHLRLPLPTGALRQNKHLTLEISDGRDSPLRYDIVVVEPSKLPQPRVKLHAEWQLGAWRASPPQNRERSLIQSLDCRPRLKMPWVRNASWRRYGPKRVLRNERNAAAVERRLRVGLTLWLYRRRMPAPGALLPYRHPRRQGFG